MPTAFPSEEKQIGEFTYKVTQLDGLNARRALFKLSKVVAPVWAKVVADVAKGGADGALAAGLGALLEALTIEDFEHFCDVFAKTTEVSGDAFGSRSPQLSTIFATHFVGDRLPDMFDWLFFCMKLNFRSFFDRASALMTKAQLAEETAKPESTSPTTSTGSSGG